MPEQSVFSVLQDLNATFAAFRKANDEHRQHDTEIYNQRLDSLEAKLARKGDFSSSGSTNSNGTESKQILFDALRGKSVNVDTLRSKALLVGNDVAGGYLAPPEYVNEILLESTEYSPIREVARQRTTTRHSVMIPKRTSTVGASWVSETGTRTETTNPSFGMEEIRTAEMYAMTKVSKQELEDSSGFDLEQFLRNEFSEQFGISVTVQVPWSISLDKCLWIGYRMVDEGAPPPWRFGAGDRGAAPGCSR